MNTQEALEYLEDASFANYSGQIVAQKDGKDHLIVCEIGCVCSEVAPKVADEYGEALVTLLNSAAPLYQALARLEAACDEAIARIEGLSGWMNCECVACPECGRMPKDCTGTACAETCSCSECDHCMAERSIGIIRAARGLGE